MNIIATNEIIAQVGSSDLCCVDISAILPKSYWCLKKKKKLDLSNPKILTESSQYFQVFPQEIIDSLAKMYGHE